MFNVITTIPLINPNPPCISFFLTKKKQKSLKLFFLVNFKLFDRILQDPIAYTFNIQYRKQRESSPALLFDAPQGKKLPHPTDQQNYRNRFVPEA